MYNRKPTRLRGYNYSNTGWYYVTLCTHNRINYFGSVIDCKMELNKYGLIARNNWISISNHFSNVFIDVFVVMPNHIHGIISIKSYVGNNDRCSLHNADSSTLHDRCSLQDNQNNRNVQLLPKIISQYKSSTSREIIKQYNEHNIIWQKSYYDQIIKHKNIYCRIKQYICDNPKNWQVDSNFV